MSALASLVASGLRGRSRVGLAATFAVLMLASVGVSVGLAVNQGGAPLLDDVADQARVGHLVVYGEPETLRMLAADPEVVASAGPVATLDGVDLVQGNDRTGLQVTALDDPAVAVNQPPQRAGRWARDRNEIVVDRSLAADTGVAVGDRISVGRGATVAEFAVVGTAVNLTDCFYPNCDPGRVWVTSGGMDRLAPGGVGTSGQSWLRFADPAQADPFVQRQAAAGVTGVRGTDSWLDTRGDFLALDQVLGAMIAGFGGFVLIAAAVIVAGTMTVRTVARRREMGLLQAVGCTPGQIAAALLAEHLAVGTIAAVVGWFLGGFASPTLRVGIAAALGPPGFSWPLLGLGVALVTVWAILTAATLGPALGAIRRPLTEMIRDAPPERAGRLARRLAGLPRRLVALGLRETTGRPARSLLAALALAVAVVAAVVTGGFVHTLDRAVADPARVGDPWDVAVAVGDATNEDVEAALTARGDVAGWFSELGRRSTYRDGVFLSRAIGGDPADAGFVLGGGRPMTNRAGEAIAGYAFLQRFGLKVGDTVRFRAGTAELQVHIVGWYQESEDSGEILQYRLETLQAVEQAARPDVYRVTAATGSTPASLAAGLGGELVGTRVEAIDAGGDDMAKFKQALWLIAAILGFMAAANLGTTLLTASREAARRIGVEQTLGFTPAQLTGQGALTGAAMGLFAVVVGLPAGFGAYRLAGTVMTGATGVGPGWMLNPTLPVVMAIAVVAVAVGAALGALATGRLAGHTAAELVRWE